MLQRIKTENGECWAVVFNYSTTLEEITMQQKGMIEIMKAATLSDVFDSCKEDFYSTLDLLGETFLPTEKYFEIHKHLTA